MNDLVRAAILGVIEGLSEFLPISSTGHLLIASPLLGIEVKEPPWEVFTYFIQIGAILSVVIYFFRSLNKELSRKSKKPASAAPSSQGPARKSKWKPRWVRNFTKGKFYRKWSDHLLTKLLVAFMPAAVIGLAFNKKVEQYLEYPVPIAIALIVGAGVMILLEARFARPTGTTIDKVTLRQALFIGFAQCVSIIPGTSRAMATILGGMCVGLSPATATQFSFYLAIPTLFAAGGYKLVKHRDELTGQSYSILAVGFVVSFFVAWAVVAVFMRYMQKGKLRPFAYYRVVLGLAVLGWWWTHHRH